MSLEGIARAATELALSPEELRRYGRHLSLPEIGIEGQKRLKAARVLLIGAGGLGSPVGLYLAAAGVGTLGVVDDDAVEESNLHRQVLFGHSDLGRPKVEAAGERLRDLNPALALRPHPERLTPANARALIDAYDVVVDGSDNFPTRYLVNDACVLAGKPDVWGAVLRFEGQASVFWAERGPCYRCLHPEPPPPGLVPSCAEGGVVGVLPGIIGALQANEAIKLLVGVGEPLIGRLVVLDALGLRWRELRLKKNPACPRCGDRPTQTDPAAEAPLGWEGASPLVIRGDRGGIKGPVCAAAPGRFGGQLPEEISVEELAAWRAEDRPLILLDVREPWEHQLCKIAGSQLIPLAELPRRWTEVDGQRLIVAYCHTGVRSAQAALYLRQHGLRQVTNLRGGIDRWSTRIDPAVPRY